MSSSGGSGGGGVTKDYVDTGLAAKVDATGLPAAILAAYPQLLCAVFYNAGWADPGGLFTNPDIGLHFGGGDTGHPPPNPATAIAFWDHS